jgi:polysaccharide export outer membrane protein
MAVVADFWQRLTGGDSQSRSRDAAAQRSGRGKRQALGLLALLGLGFTTLTAGCEAPLKYDYRSEINPTQLEYVLGPGDIVDVRQWKNPDVSGRVRVLPDGVIQVPLLGPVEAAGLTVKQLREKLAKGLQRFIAQNDEMPTLTVSVDEYQGYAVSVLGEVSQPGHYQPGHYVTVLEALALAHGLTPYARGEKITILRRTDGKERRIPISYPRLAAGARPEMNLYLLRGDVVIVP